MVKRVFTWQQHHANGSASEHTRELEVTAQIEGACPRCASTSSFALAHVGDSAVMLCVACDHEYAWSAWARRCDAADAAIDAAERDLLPHGHRATSGGRSVYSETMLPPPSDEAEAYARVCDGLREVARPTLLERVRSVCWRLNAALDGAAKGWRGE